MSRAKSQAQLQREYRERLKRKDPNLVRALDHEKYRRRCLKRDMITAIDNFEQRNNHKNASVGEMNQEDSVRRPYVEAFHHDAASPVNLGLKQHEKPTRHDNARNADKSSAKKMYLVDENAYLNFFQRDAASETSEKRPIAECGLPSRIGNAEFEHKIQSVLFKLLNSGRKIMNTNFSPATNDYSHITPSSEYAGVKDIKSVETTRKPLRKKIVEKKNTRNTDRKAKKKIVPVQWDPIVF
jgi:hypothetical protein